MGVRYSEDVLPLRTLKLDIGMSSYSLRKQESLPRGDWRCAPVGAMKAPLRWEHPRFLAGNDAGGGA
jgi:hypothetical protein